MSTSRYGETVQQKHKHLREERRRKNQLIVWFIVGGLLIVTGLVLSFSHPGLSAGTPLRVGRPMPDLVLTDLTGKTVHVKDYLGKPLLINTWATWCPPCQEEMPGLQRFYIAHQSEGFTLLAINDGENPSDVSQFISRQNFTFPVLLDPTASALNRMGISGLPTSIFVGRDGLVKLIHEGYYAEDALQSEITPLLSQN